MKKAILSLLFALVAVCSWGYDAYVDGIYYTFDSNNMTATVVNESSTNCYYTTTYMGDVVIPKSVTYNGQVYSVTSIGDNAFRYCCDLQSVTIPNSVTSIGEYAFASCIGLQSMTIGNSVTSIGALAFFECTGLQSMTIPNSVTSIGNYAFRNCFGLQSVTMGNSTAVSNSATSIGDYAFWNCTGLKSVTMGNSVESIGEGAFLSCTALREVKIPNSVTNMGNNAFCDCTGLQSVTIPNSVTCNSEDCDFFFGCPINEVDISMKDESDFVNYLGRTDIYTVFHQSGHAYANYNIIINGEKKTSLTIPDDALIIENYALWNCTGMQSVTIGNSVKSIGKYAFAGCTGLQSMTIPNSVTSIGALAFFECTGLQSMTIPNSVKSMGQDVFENCSINEVYVSMKDESDFVNYLGRTDINSVFYSDDLCEAYHYLMINGEKVTSVKVPESVTGIGDYAFFLTDITSITLPKTLTAVGDYAFGGCYELTEITSKNPTPPSVMPEAFADFDYGMCALYVRYNSLEQYACADVWCDLIVLPYECRGDANGDDEVTMADVMYVVNYLLGGSSDDFVPDNANANHDSDITMADVMYIIQYLLTGEYPE